MNVHNKSGAVGASREIELQGKRGANEALAIASVATQEALAAGASDEAARLAGMAAGRLAAGLPPIVATTEAS